MKRSRYTVNVTDAAGRHLLYNTSNGAFAQLDDEASSAWDAEQLDGKLAGELERLGFTTALSDDEELERQRGIFDGERSDSSHLTFSFIPTYVCNYRCPYCYEIGHNKIKGVMNERVMDAIMSFIDRKYDSDNFGRLMVQWYGGDPSLALDQVSELSRRLTSWCDDHGVAYDAMMLTNANVIREKEAEAIAEARISSVLLTIDGPEEIHNKRRVAADGSNSYQRTIEAAHFLRQNGIRLFANMNTDKVNMPYYESLREKLLEEEGIALSTGKLNDYGHFFGSDPFCKPDFDLYTHEEYFSDQFDQFAKRSHTAAEMREMMRPIKRFCTGQLDNYFIVDVHGDVYACDGRVGMPDYVKFNLLDDEDTWKLNEVTFDATRDEKCSACELLPVCQGSCIWERSCCGMPCHPFKTTIADYLGIYRSCFADASPDEQGLTVLAEPYSPEELGWQ